MAHEQETVRTLYKKLIRLYPRRFRERLGESIEQTFNDLYNERRRFQNGLFDFTVRTFTETTIGIIREHILLVAEIDPMKNVLTNIKSPALISLLFVIPFMLMEVVNTRNLNAIFNVPLFGILWLLPVLFILTGMPIVRNMRAGNNILAKPVTLLIRIVILIFIAWFWTALLIDQMPCFMGVPNCD